METIEPLLEAVREGLERAEWQLSGLQKTTSYEYEGPWEGASLRSAYAFFHGVEDDEGEGPSIELFVDETDEGVDGTLSLLVAGPSLADQPAVAAVLERALNLAGRSLPPEMPAPVSVSYGHRGRGVPEAATARVRFKARIPRTAVSAGRGAVDATLNTVIDAFRRVLDGWPFAGSPDEERGRPA